MIATTGLTDASARRSCGGLEFAPTTKIAPRERIAPAKSIPIIDVEAEGKHVRPSHQIDQNRVSRRAGRATLRARQRPTSQAPLGRVRPMQWWLILTGQRQPSSTRGIEFYSTLQCSRSEPRDGLRESPSNLSGLKRIRSHDRKGTATPEYLLSDPHAGLGIASLLSSVRGADSMTTQRVATAAQHGELGVVASGPPSRMLRSQDRRP